MSTSCAELKRGISATWQLFHIHQSGVALGGASALSFSLEYKTIGENFSAVSAIWTVMLVHWLVSPLWSRLRFIATVFTFPLDSVVLCV